MSSADAETDQASDNNSNSNNDTNDNNKKRKILRNITIKKY